MKIISNIMSCIRKMQTKLRIRKFGRLVVYKGHRYNIMPEASVLFADGSYREYIEIVEDVTLYGTLFVQFSDTIV